MRCVMMIALVVLCVVVTEMATASEGRFIVVPKSASRPLRDVKPLFEIDQYVTKEASRTPSQTPAVEGLVPPPAVALTLTEIPRPTVAKKIPDGGSAAIKVFDQYAVIAWNEREEILHSWSAVANEMDTAAVVSILPLAGKPLSVKRSNPQTAIALQKVLFDKTGEDDSYTEKVLYWAERYGWIEPHSIAAYEASSIEELEDAANAFLAKIYPDKSVSIDVSAGGRDALSKYFEQGFKYFVLDLSAIPEYGIKAPIEVKFESKSVYYPTMIGACGGTGPTRIRLAVFTSDDLTIFGELSLREGTGDYDIFVSGIAGQEEKFVEMASKELIAIDPTLSELFGRRQVVLGQWFIITGDLDKFTKDVIVLSPLSLLRNEDGSISL